MYESSCSFSGSFWLVMNVVVTPYSSESQLSDSHSRRTHRARNSRVLAVSSLMVDGASGLVGSVRFFHDAMKSAQIFSESIPLMYVYRDANGMKRLVKKWSTSSYRFCWICAFFFWLVFAERNESTAA